jgi:hypothetical protein
MPGVGVAAGAVPPAGGSEAAAGAARRRGAVVDGRRSAAAVGAGVKRKHAEPTAKLPLSHPPLETFRQPVA